MTSPAWALPGILTLSAVVGCSAPVVEGPQDLGEGAENLTVQGFVVVERVVAEGHTQTSVSAKFIGLSADASGGVATATEIAGSAFALPELGTCAPVDAAGSIEPPATAELPSPIKLIDVGDVTVKISDASSAMLEPLAELQLARRAFPDVGDLISGVFYTSPDADRDLPAPASYSVESTSSVDSADSTSSADSIIAAEAPAPPALVQVAGQALADPGRLVVEAGTELDFQWEVARSPRTGDLIYVDLVSALSGQGLRCTFVDTGEAALPASMMTSQHFGGLVHEGGPSELNISLHRVRTEVLEGDQAPVGIDRGEVRFDLSVVGTAILVTPI